MTTATVMSKPVQLDFALSSIVPISVKYAKQYTLASLLVSLEHRLQMGYGNATYLTRRLNTLLATWDAKYTENYRGFYHSMTFALHKSTHTTDKWLLRGMPWLLGFLEHRAAK